MVNEHRDNFENISRGKYDFYWMNRVILFPSFLSNHVSRVQAECKRIFSRFFDILGSLGRVNSTGAIFYFDTRI